LPEKVLHPHENKTKEEVRSVVLEVWFVRLHVFGDYFGLSYVTLLMKRWCESCHPDESTPN
jgi:hypothetical protein